MQSKTPPKLILRKERTGSECIQDGVTIVRQSLSTWFHLAVLFVFPFYLVSAYLDMNPNTKGFFSILLQSISPTETQTRQVEVNFTGLWLTWQEILSQNLFTIGNAILWAICFGIFKTWNENLAKEEQRQRVKEEMKKVLLPALGFQVVSFGVIMGLISIFVRISHVGLDAIPLLLSLAVLGSFIQEMLTPFYLNYFDSTPKLEAWRRIFFLMKAEWYKSLKIWMGSILVYLAIMQAGQTLIDLFLWIVGFEEAKWQWWQNLIWYLLNVLRAFLSLAYFWPIVALYLQYLNIEEKKEKIGLLTRINAIS
jgi:hypothetical protein